MYDPLTDSEKQVDAIRDSEEQVDAIINSEELVDTVSDSKSDPSSNPKVATYTTNGNFPQKKSVPKIIQDAILPIDQLVTEGLPGIQETLRARQTMLLKEIVTDAVCSGARIFRNPREVSRTGRDRSTPQDVNTAVATSRLTLQIPNFISTSNSPTRTGTQDISIPRRSIITQKGRNSKPLDAPVNQFPAVYGHPRPIFSKVISPKTFTKESADIYALKMMDFGSNPVVSKSSNFMDYRLSLVNTTDKLKSVIGPTNRVEKLTNGADWLAYKHGIE